jgi:hypothetical protein
VGEYSTSSAGHGHLKKGTNVPTNIDCTAAFATYAAGINDDAQIAGFYTDSAGVHGFFLPTSTGSCVTYTGPFSTNAYAVGINGSGQIAGFYNDSYNHAHGFLWNAATDGNISTMDIGGAVQTQLLYINNNGQIAGQYQDSSGNWYNFIYEEARRSYQVVPNDPNGCTYAGCSLVTGINDSAQVTGCYTTSTAYAPCQGVQTVYGFVVSPD